MGKTLYFLDGNIVFCAGLSKGIQKVEKRIKEDRFAHKIKDLEEDLTERRRR